MEQSLSYLTVFVVAPFLHFFISIKEVQRFIYKKGVKYKCVWYGCVIWDRNNEQTFRKKNNFNVKTFEQ